LYELARRLPGPEGDWLRCALVEIQHGEDARIALGLTAQDRRAERDRLLCQLAAVGPWDTLWEAAGATAGHCQGRRADRLEGLELALYQAAETCAKIPTTREQIYKILLHANLEPNPNRDRDRNPAKVRDCERRDHRRRAA
jgi:hypothetical protein